VAQVVKLLVTGAAGFIGYHTALRLLERGDKVIGLDNLNAYYDPELKEARLGILRRHVGFRFVKIDVVDREAESAEGESYRAPCRPAGSPAQIRRISRSSSREEIDKNQPQLWG